MAIEAFNMRQLCYYKPDKHYRVYSSDNDLWFVWLANQNVMELAFEIINVYMLGLGLGFRKYFLKKFCDNIQAASKKADRIYPQQTKKGQKRHYRKKLNEVVNVTLYHASAGVGHGKPVGFCRFLLTNNKTIKYQFENNEQMKKAIEILPGILGDKLKVNVKWDEENNSFVKI